MFVEGLWFDSVRVRGTAIAGGVATDVDAEMTNVYLIHEDVLLEMLKQ